MINWDTLIKIESDERNATIFPKSEEENTEILPKSGARPTALSVDSEKVGQLQTNRNNGFRDSAPLAPLAPLKKRGVGLEQENNPPDEGGASDNFCDAKTYPVNPIAICMLLICCNKVTASGEEIFEQIMKLQTMPQPEQIRLWAMTCQKCRIDPFSIIYPFLKSSNKGIGCQGCKHIDMQKIPTDKRPVYRFVCNKQHHMLEAYYVGERILIAPESCNDFQSTV